MATRVRAWKMAAGSSLRENEVRTPEASTGIAFDYVPTTPEDFARCVADPMWRLCSGQLYKIKLKQLSN